MESAPYGRVSDVRAEVSPAPTPVSGGGMSRPSTRATVRDGILLRWNDESNPMLRRPRTASSEGQLSNRSSAKISKARFNVLMRKQRVTGLVKAIASSPKPVAVQETAAELNYEAAQDVKQPYRHSKKQVLRQYHIRHGIDVSKMDLPPLPPERKPQSRVDDPYIVENEAARQMVNSNSRASPSGYQSHVHQPVSALMARSSHIYSRPCKASYLNRVCRRSSAAEEYRRIAAMEDIVKESDIVPRPSSVSVQTFCKAPRPQTAVPHLSTEPKLPIRQRRAVSCVPKLRFQEKENYYKPKTTNNGIPNDQSSSTEVVTPLLSERKQRILSAKSRRSCWLSPLEMCNVAPDVKLKYIANSEKKRFVQMMSHTDRLLRNETTPLQWNDKLVRELMEYKPQLEDDDTTSSIDSAAEKEEERQRAYSELLAFLESSKDEPLLHKVISHLASNARTKRLRATDEATSNVMDSVKTTCVNPILIGSETSKALMAGFYMLMKGHNAGASG